jgi:hypothetical protein
MRGVFVAPMKRFAFATAPMLPPSTMVALIPLAVLVVVARRTGGRLAHWATALLAAFLLWMLRLTAINKASYQLVWESARNLIPALAIVGVAVLWRMRPADRDDPLLRRRTLLIVAVTALCSLVQYPYAEPNYFCYVAPLVALSAAALSVYAKPIGRAVPALAAGFYLLFAVLRANTTTLFTMGYAYVPYGPTMPLHLERAGPITVFPADVGEYEALIPIVRAHARGEYLWASPDCPEVYFLAGLRNPTRSLFDFFDASEGRDARILGELDAHAVNVIVLNRAPSFSRWLSPGLLLDLYARYPHAANAGRFHVRWRS